MDVAAAVPVEVSASEPTVPGLVAAACAVGVLAPL
jgi:hypothetical protein